MSEFTCWNPPRYCHELQKEMCTFPPRLRMSVEGRSASTSCAASLNVEKTSAAAKRERTAGGQRR